MRAGVPKPESIADHMYRMVRGAHPSLHPSLHPTQANTPPSPRSRAQSLMAMLVGTSPGLDACKCVKMALVHDLAEAIVGDITPHDGVSKAEKAAREGAAVERIQLALGPGAWRAAGDDILALWQECVPPRARASALYISHAAE